MVDNSNMPHPKCLGSQKNPGTEPKTCEKGPKLGFEYLPTSKTLHCVRTACMAFPQNATLSEKELVGIGSIRTEVNDAQHFGLLRVCAAGKGVCATDSLIP